MKPDAQVTQSGGQEASRQRLAVSWGFQAPEQALRRALCLLHFLCGSEDTACHRAEAEMVVSFREPVPAAVGGSLYP